MTNVVYDIKSYKQCTRRVAFFIVEFLQTIDSFAHIQPKGKDGENRRNLQKCVTYACVLERRHA